MLWNPAAERITGVPQADALGRTPTEALGRPLDAGEGVVGGSRLLPIRRGGEEVWLSLSEAVMTDPGRARSRAGSTPSATSPPSGASSR